MRLENEDIDKLLTRMSADLQQLLEQTGRREPVIIGTHTGGFWIAERLQRLIPEETPLGALNIAFYRDDFSRIGMHPRVAPSSLPFSVEDRHVILVDDVLYTGRTIRAAMNEIFDYGRPASICLVVLIERSGHELPVRADIAGKSLTLKTNENIKLVGPEPLALETRRTS